MHKKQLLPLFVSLLYFLWIYLALFSVLFKNSTVFAATCTQKTYQECEQGNPTTCLPIVGLHHLALVTLNTNCTYTCKDLGPCTTPTPTHTPTPTPTLTPTPTPTLTPAVSPSSNPTLTDTLTPTPTVLVGNTTFSIQLVFPGIDNKGGNASPHNPQRKITIYFFNTVTKQIITQSDTVAFDGQFFSNPRVTVQNIPTGVYQIFISTNGYLVRKFNQNGSDTFTVTQGNSLSLPATILLPGDVSPVPGNFNRDYGDNTLDILDYNAINNCFGSKLNSSSCMNKTFPDVNDDGAVDGTDYNLFLRSLNTTKNGDVIPTLTG